MPTLRDRVRSALGRTEPGEREARAELDTILGRARGEPARRARRNIAVFAMASLAVGVTAFVVLRPKPPEPEPAPPVVALPTPIRPPTANAGVHLYLHVEGEPPEKAMRLDLTSQGEL